MNHYYFYIHDADFGPLFIKVCSYAPWAIKLCLNGHEWAKRQLENKQIAYEALDNGFLSCAHPKKLQEICDSLGPGNDVAIKAYRGFEKVRLDRRLGVRLIVPRETGIHEPLVCTHPDI